METIISEPTIEQDCETSSEDIDTSSASESPSEYDEIACINDAVRMISLQQDMQDTVSSVLTMLFITAIGVYVFASLGVAQMRPQHAWSTAHVCATTSVTVEELYSRYELWMVLMGVMLVLHGIPIMIMAQSLSRWSAMHSNVQWFLLSKTIGIIDVS